MKSRWFTCDEVLERDGAMRCCIISEAAFEAMQQPDDGDVRCKKHGALLGTMHPVSAYSEDDARNMLETV